MSGYFDLQVNGYGGVDFNRDDLDAEGLREACRRLEADGVEGILATVITEQIDTMVSRINNLARLRESDPLAQRIIQGIHIEGPFLSGEDGYRGAHPADAIRNANEDDAKRLVDAADGLARVMTLAPERDPGGRTTKTLTDRGIRVSAGHCNPDYDQLARACDAGLSLFTHLGNGCPQQIRRHDNIIQRALSLRDRLWLCFIGDGVHVPVFALGNYLRSAGLDSCIVVTDAIAPAGLGPGRYTLSRWTLDIGEDLVARAPSGDHLVGSAVTFPKAWQNLTDGLGLTDEQARTLTVHNPRKALGLAG